MRKLRSSWSGGRRASTSPKARLLESQVLRGKESGIPLSSKISLVYVRQLMRAGRVSWHRTRDGDVLVHNRFSPLLVHAQCRRCRGRKCSRCHFTGVVATTYENFRYR